MQHLNITIFGLPTKTGLQLLYFYGFSPYFNTHSGVILYAMVCGRLPFGDDTQVKKTQERLVSFNRPLTLGKQSLIMI